MNEDKIINEIESCFLDLDMTAEQQDKLLAVAKSAVRLEANPDRWLKDKEPAFYRGMLAALRVMASAQMHFVPENKGLDNFHLQFVHEIATTLLTVINK